jgi:hypothetical protein
VATKIRLSTTIGASRARVWDVIRDIGGHVRWMHDAEAIRFTSRQREGIGTTFECDSRLGPFRLTDRMEVVEWREGRALAIRHVGMVTGVGRFALRSRPGGTLFVWQEDLRFPWWMGGRLASTVAAPLLRRVWKRNLATLKETVEATRRGFRPVSARGRARRR